MARLTVTPQEQAAAYVARYGARAAKFARERLAAAIKRGFDREVERYWRDVERAIAAMQAAGEAPIPVWGAVSKDTEHRTKDMHMMVPPSWYRMVEKAAAAAGISVTEWVIKECTRAARRGAAKGE